MGEQHPSLLNKLKNNKNLNHKEVSPQLFRLGNAEDAKALSGLIESVVDLQIANEIEGQLFELHKIRNPKTKIEDSEQPEFIDNWKKENNLTNYGVWVYYPWLRKLVHILDEDEFVELRTSRNKYKITDAEQQRLAKKTVGVIGLSVGQQVAVCMAIERLFGTIRIADFDTLELSNLNRIREGVGNLGLPKTTVVAREIAEIDPYLNVEVYDAGITKDNLDKFLTGGGHLDLLIEECDSLPIKLMSRLKARALGIPVLMDTSDKGMIDIERFDREPAREIFHGLLGSGNPMEILAMKPHEQFLMFYKLVGGAEISSRLKASYLEMNQTLTTWPQLASAVGMGGSIICDVARKILLGLSVPSGRFYVDIDTLIPLEDENLSFSLPEIKPLDQKKLQLYVERLIAGNSTEYELSDSEVNQMVEAGRVAPSSGNDQPWMFVAKGNKIFVFHEFSRTYSFGDFNDFASLQSIGAAIENIYLTANQLGLSCDVRLLDESDEEIRAVAELTFARGGEQSYAGLSNEIYNRITNRVICERIELEGNTLQVLSDTAESVSGLPIKFLSSEQERMRVGQLIGACDLLRVFNEQGHFDFFTREMRWSAEEAEQRKVGMHIDELEIDPQLIPIIKILENYEVVKLLEEVGGGKQFGATSMIAAKEASAFGVISAEGQSKQDLINVGRTWERMWLKATSMGLSIHPMVSPIYMFPRYELNEGFSEKAMYQLKEIKSNFYDLFKLDESMKPLFLFRVFKSDHQPTKSHRLNLSEVFINLNKSS